MIGTSACCAACSSAARRAGSFTRPMALRASRSSARVSRRPSRASRPSAGSSGRGANLPGAVALGALPLQGAWRQADTGGLAVAGGTGRRGLVAGAQQLVVLALLECTNGPAWQVPQVFRQVHAVHQAGRVGARQMFSWATKGSNVFGCRRGSFSQPTLRRPCADVSQSDRCEADTDPGLAKWQSAQRLGDTPWASAEAAHSSAPTSTPTPSASYTTSCASLSTARAIGNGNARWPASAKSPGRTAGRSGPAAGDVPHRRGDFRSARCRCSPA